MRPWKLGGDFSLTYTQTSEKGKVMPTKEAAAWDQVPPPGQKAIAEGCWPNSKQQEEQNFLPASQIPSSDPIG